MQLDRKARVHEIRAANEEKIAMSSVGVHRSRSPIRGPVHREVSPMLGVMRSVPIYEDHIVETRVPVMDRVERTFETRSRSPLLHSAYQIGSHYEASRMSAATPTVNK